MYEQIAANKRKTILLMIFFILVIIGISYIFDKILNYGYWLVGFALIFAFVSSFFSYYYSDKIALAVSKARPVKREKEKELYRIVENLCIASGLPMPKIYVIESPALNAFATGRNPNHASIAVTRGLLDKLERVELEGVIAHELSHIKNYDILLMTIVVVLVGMVALLSDWFFRIVFWGKREKEEGSFKLILLAIALVLALLAPLVGKLIQFAISRKREFLADASAALLTRYPEGLARALEKIASDTTPLTSATKATAHLFIANPFKGKTSWLTRLFSTHPPIEERIKALREMIK